MSEGGPGSPFVLTVAYFFMLGTIAGIVTGIPVGPSNVAVIDNVYRNSIRRAIAVGAGAAFADGWVSAFGILVVGSFLEEHPQVRAVLFCISGVVLVIYGIITLRAPALNESPKKVEKSANPSKEVWSGFLVGIIIILMNPSAIVAWTMIVAPYFVDADFSGKMGGVGGIVVGSFIWFCFVAYLAAKGKKMLGDRSIWVLRIVAILLIGAGIFYMGRGLTFWL